jgi:hypothetical protein
MIPMNTPVSGGTGSVGLGRSNAIFRAPMNNMQSPVAPSPALANQPRMGVM